MTPHRSALIVLVLGLAVATPFVHGQQRPSCDLPLTEQDVREQDGLNGSVWSLTDKLYFLTPVCSKLNSNLVQRGSGCPRRIASRDHH